MRQKITKILKQYRALSVLALTAVIAGVLTLLSQPTIASILLTTSLLGFVILLLIDVWRTLQTGRYGVNLIAPVAVMTSIFTSDLWVGLALSFGLLFIHKMSEIAIERAKVELNDLVRNRPNFAVTIKGRKTTETPLQSVEPGDKLFVPEGLLIPVDGVVVSGQAEIKQFNPGGRKHRSSVQVGDTVTSGSLIANGEIVIRATALSRDSYYERFIRLLQNSNRSTTPFIRVSERLTLAFSVVVLFVAMSAWMVQDDPKAFLAVLAVATPIALTATSRIITIRGLNAAARIGLFFKSGTILEHVLELRTLIIHSELLYVGTEATLSRIIAKKPYDSQAVLSLAATLSAHDSSIVGRLITKTAADKDSKLHKIKHIVHSQGVSVGRWQGKDVWFGSKPALLERVETDVFDPKSSDAAYYLLVDGSVAGVFSIDQPASVSKKEIHRLKVKHMKDLFLASHVSADTTKLATSLGFDSAVSDVTTQATLQSVSNASHKPVAYASTRPSDAPVLTASDIGISMNAYDQTLCDHANIIATRPGMSTLRDVFSVAQTTFKKSVFVTFLGIMLVFIGMGLAVLGYLPPIIAVAVQTVLAGSLLNYSASNPSFTSRKRL